MNPSTFNHYHDALDSEPVNPDINARAIPTLTALWRTVMRQLADGKTTDDLLGTGLWEEAITGAAEEVLEMAEFAETRNALESPPPGGKAMKPRANAPWTKEEDARLAKRSASGCSAQDLAEEFQRSRGAITSRLAKLQFADFVRRPHNQFSSRRASV